jgi:glycosyltransferase involved in cell wall biosynthesis
MKLAIISIALPPSQSGQSLVLFQLLKNFPSDTYCLITQKNKNLYRLQGNCIKTLPAPYHYMVPDNRVTQRVVQVFLYLRIRRLLDIVLAVRTYQIKKILEKERITTVVACTGDLFDPPAAFCACRVLGIPFVLYTFDYYSRQWTHPLLRSFAEQHEGRLVKNAARVIVPNECMQEEYSRNYGIRADIIHNPFDITEYEKNAALIKETGQETSPGSIKIVYTGAVYDANFSAFHNLIVAIKKTGISGLTLHLYTPQSAAYLSENNIIGPVEIHQHLPHCDMPGVQINADIIFLPLAFHSPYPKIIKTSAPGKIGEYLASGRPVLVHAPAGSFLSWYFRKYSCGYVVDQDDPDALAGALIRLLNDRELVQKITENAYLRAKDDFDVNNAEKKFQDVLNL